MGSYMSNKNQYCQLFIVTPRPNPPVNHRFHGRCAWDPDCPHIPTLVFSAHFVLTRAHPGSTSRSVTHPKTTPSLARLTWEFFPDGLPEKKVHLVDMSSLSFLLRSWAVTLILSSQLLTKKLCIQFQLSIGYQCTYAWHLSDLCICRCQYFLLSVN